MIFVFFLLILSSDTLVSQDDIDNLSYISRDELYQSRNNFLIIDVRSEIEFEVIHIKSAINIPLMDLSKKKLDSLDQRYQKDIVFYCNGKKCKKSYKATEKAQQWGYINTIQCYSLGVFDYAKKYPKDVMFMGKVQPAVVKTFVIKGKGHIQYLIDARSVKEKALSGTTKIYDLRDVDRQGNLKLENVEAMSLQHFLHGLKEGNLQKEDIIVIDNVGRQIRWIYYYLVEKGFRNFSFLEEGGMNENFNLLLK